MKEMIKNTLILFVITVIAGAMLGLVFDITKEPIARQEEKKIFEANKEVFEQLKEIRQ